MNKKMLRSLLVLVSLVIGGYCLRAAITDRSDAAKVDTLNIPDLKKIDYDNVKKRLRKMGVGVDEKLKTYITKTKNQLEGLIEPFIIIRSVPLKIAQKYPNQWFRTPDELSAEKYDFVTEYIRPAVSGEPAKLCRLYISREPIDLAYIMKIVSTADSREKEIKKKEGKTTVTSSSLSQESTSSGEDLSSGSEEESKKKKKKKKKEIVDWEETVWEKNEFSSEE